VILSGLSFSSSWILGRSPNTAAPRIELMSTRCCHEAGVGLPTEGVGGC
jgi:hypothetical protein